jgi:respiratory burst oxidase
LLAREADPNAAARPLRKLHFVWMNRDQQSFEWFRELLAELEKRDGHKLLDIHIFMTAGRSDMEGGLVDAAQEILRARSEGDIVTGLRTRTTFGPPDFDRLLGRLSAAPDLPAPMVFFCGPPPLGRAIGRSCSRLGLRFRRERF